MIRNILGGLLALIGAAAAVYSPFRPWYDGRLGRDFHLEDLFASGGFTSAEPPLLSGMFLPMAFAALVALVGVVLRSRWLVAVAGLIVLAGAVLWAVRQSYAHGLYVGPDRGTGTGAALAFAAGLLLLVSAVVMRGRRRGRHVGGRHAHTEAARRDGREAAVPEDQPPPAAVPPTQPTVARAPRAEEAAAEQQRLWYGTPGATGTPDATGGRAPAAGYGTGAVPAAGYDTGSGQEAGAMPSAAGAPQGTGAPQDAGAPQGAGAMPGGAGADAGMPQGRDVGAPPPEPQDAPQQEFAPQPEAGSEDRTQHLPRVGDEPWPPEPQYPPQQPAETTARQPLQSAPPPPVGEGRGPSGPVAPAPESGTETERSRGATAAGAAQDRDGSPDTAEPGRDTEPASDAASDKDTDAASDTDTDAEESPDAQPTQHIPRIGGGSSPSDTNDHRNAA